MYTDGQQHWQVEFWEDDDTDCVIKTKTNVWGPFFTNVLWTTGAFFVTQVSIGLQGGPGANDQVSCGALCTVANWSYIGAVVIDFVAALSQNDDDPVGMLVPNNVLIGRGLPVEPLTTHALIIPKADGSYIVNGFVRLAEHTLGTVTH